VRVNACCLSVFLVGMYVLYKCNSSSTMPPTCTIYIYTYNGSGPIVIISTPCKKRGPYAIIYIYIYIMAIGVSFPSNSPYLCTAKGKN
jgi:hypothetical protein